MSQPEDTSVQCRLLTVRSRTVFVRQRYGDEGYARYRAAASAALGALLDDPGQPDRTWIPFELMVESTTLVDQLFGTGDLSLARELGYFSSTTNAGPWKTWALRHVPVTVVMQLAASVWRHYYSHGRFVIRPSGDAMLGTVEGFPAIHRAHCLVIVGWLYGIVEMGPRKNIVVEELSCRALGDSSCAMRTSWDRA